MMIHLNKVFFFTMMVMGVILSISADSWFGAWCGLELNLLSFIPFVCLKKDVYTSESCLKYFLIQAMGSAIIVLGCMFIEMLFIMKVFIVLALMLKMGAAPVHFWFPSVMSGLNWGSCMILMSVQKISPLGLLSYTLGEEDLVFIVMIGVIFGVFVGSVGGLNQVFLRKIVAYSSINHMSWMLVGMLLGDRSWIFYFIFYVIISGSVLYLFYSQQMSHISHMSRKWSFLMMLTHMCLLSLGGLPPFSGFVPKWIIINEMMKMSMYFSVFFLLAGTLVSLYYYLRLIFMSLTLSSLSLSWGKTNFFYLKKMSLFVFVSFMGLLGPSLFVFL